MYNISSFSIEDDCFLMKHGHLNCEPMSVSCTTLLVESIFRVCVGVIVLVFSRLVTKYFILYMEAKHCGPCMYCSNKKHCPIHCIWTHYLKMAHLYQMASLLPQWYILAPNRLSYDFKGHLDNCHVQLIFASRPDFSMDSMICLIGLSVLSSQF